MSAAAVAGMAVGVAALVLVLSIMNGFEHELRNRILGVVPHALVSQIGSGGIEEWQVLREELLEVEDVVGIAPYTEFFGMLAYSGEVAPVQIIGVEPPLEDTVSAIKQHIVRGEFDDIEAGTYRVALGNLLAARLRVGVGDNIQMFVPHITVSPGGVFPRARTLKVAAIFQLGADLDRQTAYLHHQDAAKLLRIDGPQSLRMKTTSLFNAQETARRAANLLDQKSNSIYRARDWSHTHGTLFRAIALEQRLIGMLLALIVLVAAYNLFAVLIMVVANQRSNIAILVTMGTSVREILLSVWILGAWLSAKGVFAGAVIGVGLSLIVTDLVSMIERFIGYRLMDMYFINFFPSRIEPAQVVTIVLGAWICGLLATIIPAYRAASTWPAEVLRNG